MLEKLKKENWNEKTFKIFNWIIYGTTLFIFVLSILFFFLAKSDSRKHYLLLCIMQSGIMLLALASPTILKKHLKVILPRTLQMSFVGFCFGGLILGDVFNWYAKIPYWDSILHTFSGVLIAELCFWIIREANEAMNISFHASPIYICIVVVLIALSLGALWEIGGFFADEFFGMNTQQYMATTQGSIPGSKDVPLVGHEALTDTMKDLILDLLGAVFVAIHAFFVLRKDQKKKALNQG